MLGILLSILKIIGITLLIILAVILALVLILLFVPLRYRLNASYLTGDISISARARFLFPLLSVYFEMEKGSGGEVSENKHVENGMSGGVKIFGIRIVNLFPTEEEKKKQEETEISNTPETGSAADAEDHAAKSGEGREAPYADHTGNDGFDTDAEENEEKDDFRPGLIEKIRLFFLSLGDAYARAFDALMKGIDYLASLPDQLQERKETIVKTFRRYKRNLKRIVCIWEKDYTKRALQKAKKALLKILKAIRPRKGYVKATVGMEDVALTGQIAGYYGMLYGMFYPFFGKHVVVTPDFERNVQDAELFVKGRIRLCSFLYAAWLYFFDRDVKHLKAITKKAMNEF